MSERFQILALDGGGIKGLFSAAVLAHIEEDLQTRIVDHFDLITGTSTGGIIALALGAGMRPRDVVSFYADEGAAIFRKKPLAGVRKFFRVRYENKPLEKALRKCVGDKLLGESTKRLVIPAYNLGEDSVYLFKTPHHERLKRDYKVPMWKVALATGAAPTFFPHTMGVDHVWLVDGGVWANNPTMVGVVEAVSMLCKPLDSISVLSLGTTDEVKMRSEKLRRGGLWQWREAAVDVIMRGQSVGAFTQAQHLLGKDKVTRIDPQVPHGLFALDNVSVEAILGKAAHVSRHFAPIVKENFVPHIATEYKPENVNRKGA